MASTIQEPLTIIGVFIIDSEIKVGAVAKVTDVDNFPLHLKDGYARAIKCHTLRILLRFELEED